MDRLRARLFALVILVVVFGAGFAVGVAVDRQVAAASDAPPSAASSRSGGEDHGDEPRQRRPLVERVGLSEEQRVQVDSIFHRFGGQMAELQKEYRDQYWSIVDRTRGAMRSILTPEQAAIYDSLLAENDRRRRPDSVSLPRN